MRVSREKAAHHHQQILEAASRLFRERGIDATGIDSIAGQVGLTHGGLYSQFGSKEAIAAEAIGFASGKSKRLWRGVRERKPDRDALAAIVDNYLSKAHRDAPGRGCVLAALGAEVARQPTSIRRVFTRALKGAFNELAALMPGPGSSQRSEQAIATFSCMVGALVLARAVNDNKLSESIMKSAARATIEKASGARKKNRAS